MMPGLRLFLLRYWFVIGLLAVLAAAALAPDAAAPGGPLHIGPWVNLLFATMFLTAGLTLPSRALFAAATAWRVHAALQTWSLVAIPLLGWGLAALLALAGVPGPITLGISLALTLPTTISSCVQMTRLAGGDEATALCASALGNILGILTTTAWALVIAGHLVDLHPLAAIGQMLLVVGVPVLVGQLLRLRWAAWCDRHRGILGHLTTLILLVAMHQMFSSAFTGGRGPAPLTIGLTALGMGVLHLLLLEAGWRLAGPAPRPQRIAVAICGSHKTATLGIPLISLLLAGHPDLGLILLPLISIHVLQNVIDGLLGPWLSRRDA